MITVYGSRTWSGNKSYILIDSNKRAWGGDDAQNIGRNLGSNILKIIGKI